MTESLQKAYKEITKHMLSREATESIIKKVAVDFSEWVDTLNIEKEKEVREQLFNYWLQNIYKNDKT